VGVLGSSGICFGIFSGFDLLLALEAGLGFEALSTAGSASTSGTRTSRSGTGSAGVGCNSAGGGECALVGIGAGSAARTSGEPASISSSLSVWAARSPDRSACSRRLA
jgi:hypothetical protein